MKTPTILVIDDSATIRKMVDSHLSQEGYRVVLAPDGEQGVELAREIIPDLILLDHQLPGTTGIEVCRRIIAYPECQQIPFVVSSTLRKKAYVEYMDVPNVVDSLPKPFKPELLKMAVANALETGAMIMSSQTHGTAVPEVVGQTDQPALSGDFRWWNLREVLDFLNNGQKSGMLEVELPRDRVYFFLAEGRIQAVVSPSFRPEDVARQFPDSLKEMAPLLKFTMSCGASTQIDGLSELVDKKVIDPRMLRTLLRNQAAVLTRYCFRQQPKCFSFLPDRKPPAIFNKSALDICLAAILVEGTLNCPEDELNQDEPGTGWIRHALRGQNLDRTGLSARHVQLLSHLDATPRGTEDLSRRSGLPLDEVRRVFEGFMLSDWVQRQVQVSAASRFVVAYEPDAVGANMIRAVIADTSNAWTGHVVRDFLGLQLLLKRRRPDVLLIAVEGEESLHLPEKIRESDLLKSMGQTGLIIPSENGQPALDESLSAYTTLKRPYSKADVLRHLEQISQESGRSNAGPDLADNTERSNQLDLIGANADVFGN